MAYTFLDKIYLINTMLQKFKSLNDDKKNAIFLKTVFILTVVFKLLIMGFFSSDYQNLMFIPFVKCFLSRHGNPYQYYYDNNLLSSFPYPPIMLLIECVGGFFVTFFPNIPIFLHNLLFKLPILIMDLLGFFYLVRILKSKKKYILILYFLSPIILYASYMHGQLDIIPTAFLIGAIYYLTQSDIPGTEWKYCIFLTLSLASKFHIVAVLPLLFLYLYKKRGRKKAVILTGVPVLATIAIVLPFWGSGFINMVLFNKEQSAIGNVYIDYGSAKLLLPVLVLLWVYYQAFRINQINRDLLISMSGLLFSVFLAFVPAMPAWYIWVVPFFTLYLAGLQENRVKMVFVFGIFELLYLLYYGCFHITQFVDLYFLDRNLSWLKMEDVGMKNIVFTLMLSVFLILIISMYQYGVNSNSFYRRRNRPFTIGIAGDSGAGKSRLLRMLDELLSEEHILNIEGDGDHKWERNNENWKEMTHLNPKANYLYRQAEDIQTLRNGNAVKRADYDHNTGTFTKRRRVVPKPYIVLCGLHSLYLPQMRQVLDMKIYMDTDESLRCYWKINRDQGARGHAKTEIAQQIEARKEDAEKYIYPQKQYADLVIRYFDKNLKIERQKDNAYQTDLGIEFLMNVSINVEPVLDLLHEYGIYSELTYDDDLLHQRILIEAENLHVRKEIWERAAIQTIPQIEDLTGGSILWEDGVNGAVQLMLLVVIGEIMQG